MAFSRMATLRLLAVMVALFILGNQLHASYTAHHRHVLAAAERNTDLVITPAKATRAFRASVHPTSAPIAAATAAGWLPAEPGGSATLTIQTAAGSGPPTDPRFSTFFAGDGNDNGEGQETTTMSWEVRLSVVAILFVLCAFAIFLGFHLGERQT
jgi:hypothetical protein